MIISQKPTIKSIANQQVKKIYISRGEGQKRKKDEAEKSGKLMGLLIGNNIFWLKMGFTNPTDKNHHLEEVGVVIKDDGSWARIDSNASELVFDKQAIFLPDDHKKIFSSAFKHYDKFIKGDKPNYWADAPVRFFWKTEICSYLEEHSPIKVDGLILIKHIKAAIEKGINSIMSLGFHHEGHDEGDDQGIIITIEMCDRSLLKVKIDGVADSSDILYRLDGGYSKKYVMKVTGMGYINIPIKGCMHRDIQPHEIVGIKKVNAFVKEVFDGMVYLEHYDKHRSLIGDDISFKDDNEHQSIV